MKNQHEIRTGGRRFALIGVTGPMFQIRPSVVGSREDEGDCGARASARWADGNDRQAAARPALVCHRDVENVRTAHR